jgi:4-amino-4-deoxy-L-arabinose transferase-like glycosyltransferase
MLKDLRLSFLLVIIVTICAIWLLPVMPRDETRYFSVAWEMWTQKSFLVPLLNGSPYSHKPPLLFWLINLDWSLFGVNEISVRVIPMLFSVFNIIMVYKISLTLAPEKKNAAACASALLASTLIWQIWSFTIMFDMLLTFWALVGLYGVLSAAKNDCLRGWMLIAAGVAGGLLTKGPAVFVNILPPLLLVNLWNGQLPISKTRWYIKTLLSIAAGAAIALLWALPASIEGGETYRNAILWGQTSNRIISSFAHQRPFWWYAPVLILMFFPWIFIEPFWAGPPVKTNRTSKFCLVWFFSSLIIFSLISGKQLHYLLPVIPAMSLLTAHNMDFFYHKKMSTPFKFTGVGTAYIVLAVICLLSPLADINRQLVTSLYYVSGVLAAIGLFYLLYKFKSISGAVKSMAISTTILIFCIMLFANQSFFKRYDIKHLSKVLKEKMDQGAAVANIGTYFGQYQFLGRLNKPVVELDRNKEKIQEFIEHNPDCLIIDYINIDDYKQIKKYNILYFQPYENKEALLWEGAEYLKFLSERKF